MKSSMRERPRNRNPNTNNNTTKTTNPSVPAPDLAPAFMVMGPEPRRRSPTKSFRQHFLYEDINIL